MARNQANVYLTIWNDPDFLALSPNAKLLYFVLLTHPTLTYCGVADWQEKRLATMCGGLTIEALRQAAWELGQVRLIAVDPDTEEVLVRSFVRHDGVLKSPNTTKGMVREYGAIMSLPLRELVTMETRRAVEEHPDWKGVPEVGPVTKQFPDSTGNPCADPSEMVPDWFRLDRSNPSPNPSGNPSPDPSELVPLLLTSTSTSTSTYVERGTLLSKRPPPRNGNAGQESLTTSPSPRTCEPGQPREHPRSMSPDRPRGSSTTGTPRPDSQPRSWTGTALGRTGF